MSERVWTVPQVTVALDPGSPDSLIVSAINGLLNEADDEIKRARQHLGEAERALDVRRRALANAEAVREALQGVARREVERVNAGRPA